MKRISRYMVFSIVTLLCLTGAAFADNYLFGPKWATKGKGKVQETIFSFQVESVDPDKQYFIVIKPLLPRTKIGLTLNGDLVLVKAGIKNEQKRLISLIEGENTIGLTVYKGEISLAVSVIPPLPTSRTLHCVVCGQDGIIVDGTINVSVKLLSTGEIFHGITREDGFCAFPDLPLTGVAIATAIGDGLSGSEVISLEAEGQDVMSAIFLYQKGLGKILGTTDPMSLVQVVFKAPADFSIPHALYKATVLSDETGTFSFDGLPLGHFRIQVNAPIAITQSVQGSTSNSMTTEASEFGGLKAGSVHGELSESSPEISVEIETRSPYRIQDALINGDFSLGTFGWRIEGAGGIGWQPRWFSNQEGDPCDPIPESDDELNCGAIMATGEGTKTTLSQAFIVPENAMKLKLRVRYISEAYRFMGLSVSDDFSVRLVTLSGTPILAEGNENTYMWKEDVDISFGLVGMSYELDLNYSIEKFRGQALQIMAEVKSSMTPFSSVLAIAKVEIIEQKENMYFHSSHSFAFPATLNIEAGQAVELVFKNTNPLFGIAFVVADIQADNTQIIMIPPTSSMPAVFTNFGCEPMGWIFHLKDRSILNKVIDCNVYSTWVPGMPLNN